jgi:DNA (cytosine-5)-methyltransferase 1
MEVKFVSLYSGAGGLDLGFHRAGFTPIWANDIDRASVETHNKLFAQHVAVAGDIRLQKLPYVGSAEVVLGGPPCQGFSVAGKMDPNDPRSQHVFDFLCVVGQLTPRIFVMENVKALAVNRRWTQLRDELVAKSVELGYNTQLLLLNASHFGVPQSRERMFLIGVKDGQLAIPLPTTDDNPPTVRSALAELPAHGDVGNDSLCMAKVTPAKTPVLRRSPYAGMLFNGQGRPLDLDRPAPTLPASMGGNRTPIIDQRQLEQGGDGWVVAYHKHLWEGGTPFLEAPARLRRLTVEETAAIQTFPLGMHWAGKQSAQYRQIGNAVPPELAFHVAMAVRRSLAGEAMSPPAGWLKKYQLIYRTPGDDSNCKFLRSD